MPVKCSIKKINKTGNCGKETTEGELESQKRK